MRQPIFTGSAVALVTPFTDDGINFEEFGRLVDFQIANGTDAIVVCGTTGEPATMPDAEHKSAIEFVVRHVNHRVPVIAGTGTNDTPHAISLSVFAQQTGADALLMVTPYYNKTTPKGLIAHYTAIAEKVELPIILYNVPGRTGLNISPATLFELSKIPNVVALKEACGNVGQLAQMAALCPDIDFYSGDDNLILPALSLGAKGVISVLANIAPAQTHDMVMKYMEGNTALATEMQLRAMDLIDALFCEVNPIPVKTALRLMGYNTGKLRMPLCEMEEHNLQRLKSAMIAYGFKLP